MHPVDVVVIVRLIRTDREPPASVPDLPDATTFGEDREDALARAVDAIETALMGRMAGRDMIPDQSADAPDVELPALSVAKIALYRAMRSEGVGKAALAKRLGVALPQIDRLLDLRHQSRLDALQRALAALQRTLINSVATAA